MYAVVDIKGFQYKLETGDRLRVPKCDLEVGKKVTFSDVLLVSDGSDVKVGTPFVDGAVIEAEVVDQGKYDKVVVFKKKRRKDYAVKHGHRQDYTEIEVKKIKVSKAKAKSTAKKADAKPEKTVKEEKTAE